MAVSAAILEIFSVKEWPDLEIWVAVLQELSYRKQIARQLHKQ